MTDEAIHMVLEWLNGDFSKERIEQVARHMRDTLHIGGMKACRQLVHQAIATKPK